ncbi:MAG TPA: hypothetical protein VFA32_14995, partial [Dehalococcoidia bacterium]|nr:hypothetical protein [Dehalococcoidia bacterium]
PPPIQNPYCSLCQACSSRRLSSPTVSVSLYYRRFGGPVIKGRYICVVVKVQGDDAFVLTAYITGSIKRGETA